MNRLRSNWRAGNPKPRVSTGAIMALERRTGGNGERGNAKDSKSHHQSRPSHRITKADMKPFF